MKNVGSILTHGAIGSIGLITFYKSKSQSIGKVKRIRKKPIATPLMVSGWNKFRTSRLAASFFCDYLIHAWYMRRIHESKSNGFMRNTWSWYDTVYSKSKLEAANQIYNEIMLEYLFGCIFHTFFGGHEFQIYCDFGIMRWRTDIYLMLIGWQSATGYYKITKKHITVEIWDAAYVSYYFDNPNFDHFSFYFYSENKEFMSPMHFLSTL